MTAINLRESPITDEAIKVIAANCPALTKLNVDDCEDLTAEAIKAIAANYPSVRIWR